MNSMPVSEAHFSRFRPIAVPQAPQRVVMFNSLPRDPVSGRDPGLLSPPAPQCHKPATGRLEATFSLQHHGCDGNLPGGLPRDGKLFEFACPNGSPVVPQRKEIAMRTL